MKFLNAIFIIEISTISLVQSVTKTPLSTKIYGAITPDNFFNPESSIELYGALPPVNFFDPFNLSFGRPFNELKKFREAEIKHGRISMLASVGILVSESFTSRSAITVTEHWNSWLLYPVFLLIALIESDSIRKSWERPSVTFSRPNGLANLLEEYEPGDMRFDPLGLCPFDEEGLLEYKKKELSHGRLAMIGVAGMLAQELVDGKGIVEHYFPS